jgi:hypothetical protein
MTAVPKLCVAKKPNCQNFLFQTVKISYSKLSKFPIANCQNFLFQTVKISFFKLSKFPFPNSQNFLFQTVKISFFKLSKFPFPKSMKKNWLMCRENVWKPLYYNIIMEALSIVSEEHRLTFSIRLTFYFTQRF